MTPAQRVSALLDAIDGWARDETADPSQWASPWDDALRHLVEALDRLVCGTADPTAAGWADSIAILVEPHVAAAAVALDLVEGPGEDPASILAASPVESLMASMLLAEARASVALDRDDRVQTISLDGAGSDA